MGNYVTRDNLSRFWKGVKTQLSNKIESIKVNGTVISPDEETLSVDITVPTKVSSLENDSDYATTKGSNISNTISDNNPILQDSIKAPLIYNKIGGYTTQETVAGNQLFNYDAWKESVTVTRGTFTIENNGITIVATENDAYTYYLTDVFPEDAIINVSEGDIVNISWEETTNTPGRVLIFIDGSEAETAVANNETAKSLSYTVPSGVTKIRYRFGVVSRGDTISYKNIMINKGSSVLAYEPYCGGIASPNPDYPQDIEGLGDDGTVEYTVCGKNLLNHTMYDRVVNGLTFTVNDDNSISISGTATAQATIHLGDVSGMLKVGNKYSYSGVTNLAIKVDGVTNYWPGSGTFTMTEAVSWVSPYIQYNSGTTVDTTLYPMVYSSDLDDSYEPYTEIVSTIPIDAPLYEGDYIEEYKDGSGKLVRTMDTMEINSSLTYLSSYIYTNTVLVIFKIPNDTLNVDRSAKCNRLTNAYSNATDAEHFYIDKGNIHFYISNARLSGGGARPYEEFMTYTTSNPVYVIYKLATPVETELTSEQVDAFKKLYSFETVTNVFCDGEVTVQYYTSSDNGKTLGLMQNDLDAKAYKDGSNASGTWGIDISGTATESEISGTVSGSNPSITDSTNVQLIYNKINGYTTQDGTPTPDTPIDIEGLGDSGTVDVKTCGKNLLKNNNIGKTFTKNGVTWIYNEDGSITLNGTATAITDVYVNGGWAKDTIIVKLTRALKIKKAPDITGVYWIVLNNTSIINSGESISNDVTCVFLRINAEVTLDNVTVYPMIYYADSGDDTYEPYVETTASIPVDAPLYSGDYIEEYADGSGKLVRNVGVITLDGTESTWYLSTTYSGSFFIPWSLYENPRKVGTAIYCSHATHATSLDSYNVGCVYSDSNHLSLRLTDGSEISTVALWREYLANNPVDIAYTLTTPVETDLTAEQLTQLKQLYSFESVTNTFCDGETSIQYFKNTNNGKLMGTIYKMLRNATYSENS